jgi:hypothetical protein
MSALRSVTKANSQTRNSSTAKIRPAISSRSRQTNSTPSINAPRAANVSYLVVGEASGREISYLGASGNRDSVGLEDIRKAHESWLPAYMKKAH